MNGRQFNNIVKTMNALKPGTVPLKTEISIVDDARVSMMHVRDVTGAPVFGIEAEGRGLDIAHLPTIPDEDFEASVDTESGRYILENEETRYAIKTGDVFNEPKMPRLDDLETVTIPAKTLQKAVKELKGISDGVRFEARAGRLYMGVEADGTEVSKVLGGCDAEDFRSVLPYAYVERVAKVTVGEVRMEFATDYPTRWTWTDGNIEYMAMIAPRIEAD